MVRELSWVEKVAAGIAEEQCGIVAREQLISVGMTSAQARQPVDAGRWQVVHPGVYAVFTGPLPDLARIWAALLCAGPEAYASYGTALWLAGALPEPPLTIHVTIPADRRAATPAGATVHVSRILAQKIQPTGSPPRTRLEDAVLDVADLHTDAEPVLTLVFRVTGRRLTTPARLLDALAARKRHRWRQLVKDVLADVQDGIASRLEQRWVSDVERPHGLPKGVRNKARTGVGGRRIYDDVRYEKYGVTVELDGQAWHPVEERHKDLRRDNHTTVTGDAVLRYGWHDVTARTCETAFESAQLLTKRGWQSHPHPCPNPQCALRKWRS